jgi:hypothetical protein
MSAAIARHEVMRDAIAAVTKKSSLDMLGDTAVIATSQWPSSTRPARRRTSAPRRRRTESVSPHGTVLL